MSLKTFSIFIYAHYLSICSWFTNSGQNTSARFYEFLSTSPQHVIEHLDDHQVPFARMMQKLNYVIVAYEVGDLRDCIENLNAYSSSVTQFTKDNTKLVNHLNSLIQA